MWAVGTIVVLGVGAALTTAVSWVPRATSSTPLWDTSKHDGAHDFNVGTFAGIGLAVATFIAGLDVARTSPVYATVFGMMLVSFLILIVTGWIGGSAPTASVVSASSTHAIAFVLGSLSGNLGVSFAWLA